MAPSAQNDLQDRQTVDCLARLRDALPKSAGHAGDAARLDRVAAMLAEQSLGQPGAAWREAMDARAMPSWLEDAILLEIVPRAAARLGVDWAEDRLSFVDVSIGSANLQELVRRLGLRASRAAQTPAVPIVVPPWEQHVLASALAAHRLNRAGQRAVLITGLSADRVTRLPLVQSASVLLISATDRPARGRLEAFIDALRHGLQSPIPLIAGGSGFARPIMDRRTTTGAVCLENDAVAALRACGLLPDTIEAPAIGVAARRSDEQRH